MKKAYFVIGPESSGTRMMTRSLIAATGGYGSGDHIQPMDTTGFINHPETIVYRKSLPHAKQWVDVQTIINNMQDAGYQVTVVAMDREDKYLIPSQLRHGHVADTEEAENHIARARAIIESIPQVIKVDYGKFVHYHKTREAFFNKLELEIPDKEYYDGNERYE